jgi:hypothetical protein
MKELYQPLENGRFLELYTERYPGELESAAEVYSARL